MDFNSDIITKLNPADQYAIYTLMQSLNIDDYEYSMTVCSNSIYNILKNFIQIQKNVDFIKQTVLIPTISAGLDLFKIDISNIEEFKNFNVTHIKTISHTFFRNIIIYKFLLNNNLISNKLSKLFYSFNINHIRFLIKVLLDYDLNFLKQIDSNIHTIDLNDIKPDTTTNNKSFYNKPHWTVFKKLKFKKTDIFKHHNRFKQSICSPNNLLNILDLDSNLSLLKVHYINIAKLPIDMVLWCYINDHKFNKFINVKYKDADMKVHIHNLIDFISFAYTSNGINSYGLSDEDHNFFNSGQFIQEITTYKQLVKFSLHDFINHKNIKHMYSKFLNDVYNQNYNTNPFEIDNRFKDTTTIKLLKNRLDLYNEGIEMSHCIGGHSYANSCENKISVMMHFNTEDPKGITVEFKKDKDDLYTIQQAHGYKNRNITNSETILVKSYIDSINSNIL